jgi:hypothetical protein
LTEEKDLLLRGIATDTLSAMAEAVGPIIFGPHTVELMELVNQGLLIQNSRLVECSFCFFASCARVYGADFAPYLEHVLPPILASCNQEESYGSHFDNDDEEVDLEEDDEGEDDNKQLRASSSIAEEKEIAADALGKIFAATATLYLPYVEPSIACLLTLAEHYYEDVRKSAVNSLFLFLHTFHKIGKPSGEWEAGLPLKAELHENIAQMVEVVMKSVGVMLEDEYDKYVQISD